VPRRDSKDGHQSWYQRVRPDRPQHHARGLGRDDIDFVAVNDLTDAATLAHLLKYDSILGNLEADIEASGDRISVDGDEFQVLSHQGSGAAALEGPRRGRRLRGTGLFTNRDDAASTSRRARRR
jgi:glyceraldehyde-3-phosphate dehydrogenase/erythrose-4-phosphate dehydrogenase